MLKIIVMWWREEVGDVQSLAINACLNVAMKDYDAGYCCVMDYILMKMSTITLAHQHQDSKLLKF